MNTSDLQNIKQRYNVVGNSDGLNRALDVALQVASTGNQPASLTKQKGE